MIHIGESLVIAMAQDGWEYGRKGDQSKERERRGRVSCLLTRDAWAFVESTLLEHCTVLFPSIHRPVGAALLR